ncbi:hypothetical protein [Aeromonas salmonicida]|uniref:hypothetical protein n=1 Tax=Aeromonas salmonicida TaxID=645 RepID=UPI0030A2AA0F
MKNQTEYIKEMDKSLFTVPAYGRVFDNDCYRPFWENLRTVVKNTDQFKVTFYRAGGAVVELVFFDNESVIFVLTIWEGDLHIPPISDDDKRVAHKEIGLPDVTDIMLMVSKLAAHAGLQPSLSSDAESASVLEFIECPR